MQNFVGKTKCIAGYMKVANVPIEGPGHSVVQNLPLCYKAGLPKQTGASLLGNLRSCSIPG